MALTSPRSRLAVALYLLLIHLLALFFVLEKIKAWRGNGASGEHSTRPVAAPDETATMPAQQSPAQQNTNLPGDTGRLMIPVAGVTKKDLVDTYTQARSGGRPHNAIDIIAGEGTPVLAAADGDIAKLFDSDLGGITIYQWNKAHSRIYYYAHLQRRVDGLAENTFVKQGTVIAYVGNTGDAGPGNYHLHFGVSIPASPGRYWGGTDLNPYPMLMSSIGANVARD